MNFPKLKLLLVGILLGGLLQACTYPEGKVVRGENRPSIAVSGAPAGALLEVDGVTHGEARRFDGKPTTLLVETGVHRVRIVMGQQVLLERELYLSAGETRVLTLQREQ